MSLQIITLYENLLLIEVFENMNIVGLQYKLLWLTHPCFSHSEAVLSPPPKLPPLVMLRNVRGVVWERCPCCLQPGHHTQVCVILLFFSYGVLKTLIRRNKWYCGCFKREREKEARQKSNTSTIPQGLTATLRTELSLQNLPVSKTNILWSKFMVHQ